MTKEQRLEQEEKLWAQYGKSQAQREVLNIQLQQTTQQMSQIYAQIVQMKQVKNEVDKE